MSNSTKTFCILLAFALVSFSNATASPPPPSKNIQDECGLLLFVGMTHCLDYLGKYSRNDHPSSSCCSVVRDVWEVYPPCVNDINVLDGFILTYYVGFDRDINRVADITSACGIVDGSRKRDGFEKTRKTSRREDDDINMKKK
ncbi:non-specific lipid-transfer protein-like protein [Tanacetum coccineum]